MKKKKKKKTNQYTDEYIEDFYEEEYEEDVAGPEDAEPEEAMDADDEYIVAYSSENRDRKSVV